MSGFQVKDGLSQMLMNVQLWQVGFWFVYIHRKSDKRQRRNQKWRSSSPVISGNSFIIFALYDRNTNRFDRI